MNISVIIPDKNLSPRNYFPEMTYSDSEVITSGIIIFLILLHVYLD
jgi:hypothetical protein